MDLGVSQETKSTKSIYTRDYSGYKVVLTLARSAHSGKIVVFYRAEEIFSVEHLHTYGENVVSFQMASGDRQWFIAGCYFAPDNSATIEDIVADISQQPRGGGALLVVGDSNTNLASPEGWE